MPVSSPNRKPNWAKCVALAGLASLLCSACVTQPMTSGGISAEDYAAIQHLYAEFNTTIDLGLPDRYAATWTNDGEYTGGKPAGHGADTLPREPDVKGYEQLRAMARGTGGRHLVTNIAVTKTPGGAKATAYLLRLESTTSPPTIAGTSIYDDTLVKTPQGWKFKKRINWRDDDDLTPHKAKVPAGPPPAGAPVGTAPATR